MKMTDLFWNRSRRSNRHHAHTVALMLDSLDWARFRSFAEGHADVVILNANLDADRVAVQVGCRSAEVARRLEDAWG
ncbi:hypothetical protein HL658_03425 [Azospirillum sp. RWY-5-1]|uniref:DUF3606 domain-containing protein n=1 Tax=Azospirillum oleiclasticum TaxID=2735135 RepID=A0ABX2T3C0_9PROT|nr:hypothetical protein [Azospirillum oleiclasticum]NYZ11587.1 hypothetical protein [Azospirillum oleiclasticum]NYZ18748.1 hypothetical protein [Azospirillum oleiclasticum]